MVPTKAPVPSVKPKASTPTKAAPKATPSSTAKAASNAVAKPSSTPLPKATAGEQAPLQQQPLATQQEDKPAAAKPAAVVPTTKEQPAQTVAQSGSTSSQTTSSSATSKYEADFVDLEDPDSEEDSGDGSTAQKRSSTPKEELHLEIEQKSMSEHEKEMVKVRNSAQKIKRNLADAQASVKRRQGHIDELKALVATQHGQAKKELNKVLKTS